MKNARPTQGQPSAYGQRDSNAVAVQMGLFGPLPFFPRRPSPGTLPAIALARMLKGERLTQPSFGLHYWRLAAYIHELRDLGWPVQSMPMPSDHGRPISEYWLDNSDIAASKGDE
jgi:hypothetical protein